MQVILLLILIIIIYLAFVHWYISIPILAFLGYICNLAMCTPQQRRSPIRHILWWLFIIPVTVGMYHHKPIERFFIKTKFEYSQWTDPIFDHCLNNKENLAPLDTSSIFQPNELYGGLEVGMSPIHAVYHFTFHEDLLHPLQLDSIELSDMSRHYSDNRLYGIRFRIAPSRNCSSENLYHEATQFFSNKYGSPHHSEKTDHHHIAQWKFTEKHIVIIKPHKSFSGDLFIYNPALLQQKIDAHYLEIGREKARINENNRRLEEAIRQREKELEEARKKEVQNNLRLLESL